MNEETPTERQIRHEQHQALIEWQKEYKAICLQRHRKGRARKYGGNLY